MKRFLIYALFIPLLVNFSYAEKCITLMKSSDITEVLDQFDKLKKRNLQCLRIEEKNKKYLLKVFFTDKNLKYLYQYFTIYYPDAILEKRCSIKDANIIFLSTNKEDKVCSKFASAFEKKFKEEKFSEKKTQKPEKIENQNVYKIQEIKISQEKYKFIKTLKKQHNKLKSILENIIDAKPLNFSFIKNDEDPMFELKLLNTKEKQISKYFSVNASVKFFSDNIFPDDANYLYTSFWKVGIQIPLLKKGILDVINEKKYIKTLKDIYKYSKPYKNRRFQYTFANIFIENNKLLQNYQAQFNEDLKKHLQVLSKIDKYYLFLIKNIRYIRKTYYTYNLTFKSYKYCNPYLPELYNILNQKEENLRNYLEKLDINENISSIKSFLRELSLDLNIDFNKRFGNLVGNTNYLSAEITFELPIPFNKTSSKLEKIKLAKLKYEILTKFREEKNKILEQAININSNIEVYKMHIQKAKKFLYKLDRLLKLAQLEIIEIDIEEITNLMEKLYNELYIINIYAEKLFIGNYKLYLSLEEYEYKKICSMR